MAKIFTDAVTVQRIKNARKFLFERLAHYGIEDSVIVKVHSVNIPEAVAQYRSLSQFRSKPTFWLSPDLVDGGMSTCEGAIQGDIEESLMHEYGHVVWEWAHKSNHQKSEKLKKLLTSWDDDEEDFAEDFAQALTGRWPDVKIEKVARLYGRFLSEDSGG